MPITQFQRDVLLVIKSQRNPESYVAGGTTINRSPESPRFSSDIDLFHDTDLAVSSAYESDRRTLIDSGYDVDTQIAQPSFYRATVARGGDSIKLEWVRDTSFRFFPVVEDDDFGYRLHDVDLAINKCLALANRTALRDALDMMEQDRDVLSLPAAVAASCGKDPGFTPLLMIEMMRRHSQFSPPDLQLESLTRPIDPIRLKRDLTARFDAAEAVLRDLPADDVGCLFLDARGQVLKSVPANKAGRQRRHYGSVRGSWPKVVSL